MSRDALTTHVKEILSGALNSELGSLGFKRKRELYVRPVHEILHLIQPQYSQWNDSDEVRFTMNCGVWVPHVKSVFSNTPEPKQPKLIDCCITARVGMLTEDKRDIWWKLRKGDESSHIAQVQDSVASSVKSNLLPFLDRFESEKAVAGFLSKPVPEELKYTEPRANPLRFAYAAIIWEKRSETSRCQECLDQALSAAQGTPLAETMNAFSERFSC